MKKSATWILLADGAQARILEHKGPGKGVQQVSGLEWSIEPLLAQDIVTDRSGGNRTPAGYGRGGMEPRTDPVEHREAEFVKSVASELDKHHQNGDFERLIIAAAPIALGEIRKSISPAVKKTVVAELNKDLTNLPTKQLDQHLDGIIAA